MQIGCTKSQGGGAKSMDALMLMRLNVTSSTFGQQTQAFHGGKQIWASFYSCWGTKATKSPCYERSN